MNKRSRISLKILVLVLSFLLLNNTLQPYYNIIKAANTVSIYVNQSGYDADKAKRATIVNAADDTTFYVKNAATNEIAFTGTVISSVADFSSLNPTQKNDYYIQCGNVSSYTFSIGKYWLNRVSVLPALSFMSQARQDTFNVGASTGYAWRDGHQFSFEVNSLVMQYMANPSLYDNMTRNIYSVQICEYPELRTQNEPDIIWLIKFAMLRYYDLAVNDNVKLHMLIKEQFAYFLYIYPHIKQYVTEEFYTKIRNLAISTWGDSECSLQWYNITGENNNLFQTQNVLGAIKGSLPPGHSIIPNLMMYEVIKRDNLGDGEQYFSAAYNTCKWLIENIDIASTYYSKGQRMSEHIVMENLSYFQEMYPERAPSNLMTEIERWASKTIARSNNMWDMRMASSIAAGDPKDYWTGGGYAYGEGYAPSIMNEPGNEAGIQAVTYAAARVINDSKTANRLRQIGVSGIDDLMGRNPLGRSFLYEASRDIEGADLGWSTYATGGFGALATVVGRIDGSPKEDAYPYNASAAAGYTEGWVAFNTAWNASLAYSSADDVELSVDKLNVKVGEQVNIRLKAPLNLDYTKAEQAQIIVTNMTNGQATKANLTEESNDSYYFSGSFIPDNSTDKLEISYGYGLFKNTQIISITPVLDIDAASLSRYYTFDSVSMEKVNDEKDASGLGDDNYKGYLTAYFNNSTSSATVGTAIYPAVEQGKFGNAMRFFGNANSYYGTVLKNSSDNPFARELFSPETNEFSVSLWFKRDTADMGREQVLAACGAENANAVGWDIKFTSGNYLNIQAGVGYTGSQGQKEYKHYKNPITDEKWHNVILVISKDETNRILKGYLDGTETDWLDGSRNTATIEGPYSTITDTATILADAACFVIGGQSNINNAPINRFSGLIDDFRIYKGTALNQSQINSLQCGQVDVPLSGILLNKASIYLKKNYSETIALAYQPSDTTDDKSVQWSSSNYNVATVTNGVVTGIGQGSATITATIGSFNATCNVTVMAQTPVLDIDATSLSRNYTFDSVMGAKVYDEKDSQGLGTNNYSGYLTSYFNSSTTTNLLGSATSPTIEQGKFGNAMRFFGNANDKYGTVLKNADSSSFATTLFSPETGEFSVSLWFKRNTVDMGRDQVLAACGANTVSAIGWVIKITSGNYLNIQAGVGTTDAQGLKAFKHYKDPIIDDTWHNVVLVIVNSGTNRILKGYLDGSETNWLDGTRYSSGVLRTYSTITNTSTILPTSITFVIGGSGNTITRFSGLIDEFRLYKGTALNQTQVTALQYNTAITPLTGILLEKSSLSIVKNATEALYLNYNPTNTTDDKTVVWNSSNPSVATVSNGFVTGLKAGDAIITATVGSYTSTCSVNVVLPVDLSSFTVSKNFLTNINPNTSLAMMNQLLKPRSGVTVVYTNAINNTIGSGTVIAVTFLGTTTDYTAVIYGDVSGDGKIEINDLAMMKAHLLKTQTINDIVKQKAASIFGTGKITISDLLAVKKHLLNIQLIHNAN